MKRLALARSIAMPLVASVPLAVLAAVAADVPDRASRLAKESSQVQRCAAYQDAHVAAARFETVLPETIMNPDPLAIPNACHPAPNLITGGQPSATQLAQAKAAGIRHVINLRPLTEDAGFDEEAELDALGLHGVRIPVSGAAALTRDNVEALDAALAATQGEPTLLHCASGNRVGALMALRAAWLHGETDDAALQIGRDAGLTGMEPAVRELLSR